MMRLVAAAMIVVGAACTRPSAVEHEASQTHSVESVDEVSGAAGDGGPDAHSRTGSDASHEEDAETEGSQGVVPSCPQQAPPTVAGTVTAPELTECSGMVASRAQSDLLWAHNDSGDTPSLYALGEDGRLRGVVTVTGAEAVDWEDIAIRAAGERDELVIGDIGDNDAKREHVVLYRVAEPVLEGDGSELEATEPAQALPVVYPDGPRDAEALFADPEDGTLYIVSKEWSTGISGLYRYPPPLRAGDIVTLDKVASIPLDDLGGGLSFLATGADMSADGRWLLLRTYDDVLGWYRAPGQTVVAALGGTRCVLAVKQEPQGEAVAITPDGTGYFTLSEFTDQPLWRFGGLPR